MTPMQQLIRMWWPGAKVSGVVIAVMFLWGLLGKLYELLAGWMPEPLFWAGAVLLSAMLVPVILYAGIAEVLRLKE